MFGKVKKKALQYIFIAAFFLQAISNPVAAQSVIEDNNFDKTIRIYDANGRAMANPAIEAVGSPLFLPNWKLGWIRLADSRVFTAVPLRFDLEQQEVHYKRADGTDVDVQSGQIKQMAITDTIAGAPVVYEFLSGFPPIDNQTETSFYLVLDSGRVSLLESLRKKIFQDKNAYAGSFVKEYRLYSDLYVVINGKLIRIKWDAKFFRGLTRDKQMQMDDFLNKNTVSFKSDEDIRKFIHFYNGLAP
jgi:hypothetical protein